MPQQLSLPGHGRRFAAWTAEVRDDGLKAGARTVTFAISTEDKARDGHVIRANGWDLSSYRKNPVVLFGHDHSQPPVGRSLREWVEGKRLMSTCEFTPRDLSPMGYSVGEMYARGFMNAVSVGFDVKRYEPTDPSQPWQNWDIKEAELYEYSAVPVPADANALATARAAGIDMDPMKQWVEKALDMGLADRAALERAWKTVNGRDATAKTARLLHYGIVIDPQDGSIQMTQIPRAPKVTDNPTPVGVGVDEPERKDAVPGSDGQLDQFFDEDRDDGDEDDRDEDSEEEMAADDMIEVV